MRGGTYKTSYHKGIFPFLLPFLFIPVTRITFYIYLIVEKLQTLALMNVKKTATTCAPSKISLNQHSYNYTVLGFLLVAHWCTLISHCIAVQGRVLTSTVVL